MSAGENTIIATDNGEKVDEKNLNTENTDEIQADKLPQSVAYEQIGLTPDEIKILLQDKPQSPEPNSNGQPKPTPSEPPKEDEKKTDKKKKREHIKYIPSIDLKTLKELEGATFNSFVDLARAVVFVTINGKKTRYDEAVLPMSKARKIDLERLIAHHAQMIVYGIRKYQIKSVISRKQKEEFNDVELEIIRDRLYDETKPTKKKKSKKENTTDEQTETTQQEPTNELESSE